MGYSLKKHFRNFGGQDLRSPELLRDDTTATDTLNVSISENLSLTKRRGSQIHSESVGGAGSVTFNEVDIATGLDTQSRLVFDSGVRELKKGSVTVSYSGTDSPSVAVYVLDGEFVLDLREDGDLTQRIPLGSGVGISDSSIATALSAMSSPFSFSVTGPSSINSAYINVTASTSFLGSYDLEFSYSEELSYPTGVTNPLQAHWDTRNTDRFELNDTVQVNDVLYVTNGVSGLFKYDGLRFYKAGLPKPADLTQDSGSGTAGTYRYRIVYKHTDNKDNIIFSTPSNELELSNVSDINVPNILHGSGFDTDGTIEILILRTTDNGNLFFVVDTITNDPLNASQVYSDTAVDSDLVNDYTLPPFELNQLPICRYVDVWRGQIVLTGDPQAVNRVYYSDVIYPEGFSLSNSFETSTRSGGPNSGVISIDNILFVFKPTSITAVTGDLATSQFQVDTLSDEGIGCLSNATLVESRGRIWFLGRRGIYSVNNEGVRLESDPLTPIFTTELRDITTLRSVGFYWINDEVLLFSLPKMSSSGSERYVEQDSRILAYHVQTAKWTVWSGIDFSSGINQDQDDVWFCGSFLDSNNVVNKSTSQFLRTFTRFDYADQVSPIRWEYKANWETLGEPSVPKKFVRLKLYSLDTPLQAFVSTDFSIDIETNHDYIDEIVSKTSLAFSEDGSGWGAFPWGQAPWGEIKSLTRRTRLLPKKARSLRTVLKNSELYENVLLSGFEFEVAAIYDTFLRNR